MCHVQKILQDEFLGKPYVIGGRGDQGFDCLTLTMGVLSRFKGIVTDREVIKKYREFYSFNDVRFLFKEMQKHLELVWKGSYTNFKWPPLKQFDVLIFRVETIPCHLGTYIGNNEVITTTQDSCVRIISLTDPHWFKRIYAQFRG